MSRQRLPRPVPRQGAGCAVEREKGGKKAKMKVKILSGNEMSA